MASLPNGTRPPQRLIGFIASVGLALVSPAWAATLLQSAGTFDATAPSTTLVAVSPVYSLCTMIYPRDVQERTYHIVSPGKYCLASDLNATPPTFTVLPTPGDLKATTNPIHSGAAIHIHASNVDVDFRRYALNDSGATAIQDGVRIDPGLSNVYVHDGVINGFDNGLSGSGAPSLTLSGIRIQRMKFYGSTTGAFLGTVRNSTISQNTFAENWMGLGISNADAVTVSGNRFDLPPVTASGWAVGLYTSWGLRNLTITDNVVNGRGRPFGMGIHLHNHSSRATNEELSRGNRVERNVLYAVEEPIVVSGSGIASNNVIRQNQIYGDTGVTVVRTYPSRFPKQFSAIRVDNNQEIEISGNYIFTGLRIPYYYGISLAATTVKRDSSGASTLRYNQTCGVADSLVPPSGVPESSIDGGNYWNSWCQPPQIQ